MSVLTVHLNVCMCTAHTPVEVRNGYQISWNSSYTWVKMTCVCWELNLGPLQEQL